MTATYKEEVDNKTTGYVFYTLTPSDITEYPPRTGLKALYILTAGDVVLVDHGDNTTTFLTLSAGTYLYLRPKIVKSTGTTASILGIFA